MWKRLMPVFLLLAPAWHAQDLAGKADEFVRSFAEQKRFQGSVLLAQDGKPLFRKSYGLADAEWDVSNTPDTKFRLGSITKQFTSALILQLVEQGKIKLDDSVRKYYPAAPDAWQPVTIHDLLSHQSGIPSYTELPGFFEKLAGTARTPLEIIQLTEKMPLEFDPGTQYKYDNTGYIVLGYIIEKVTGKSYEQQLHQAILDPLGMHDTGFDHYTAILHHRAEGYEYDGGTLRRAPFLDMSLPYAAGSLYSTVDDLLKWDQALYGTQVLSAASKEKMWTPNRSDYGYGWQITTRFGEHAVEHGGGINGFNTMIIRIPEKKLLAVTLANANTNATGPIAAGLLGLALGHPAAAPKTHTRIGLTVAQMKPFEGVYALNGDFKLTIKVDGDHLSAQATGQNPVPLQPLSATGFFNDGLNLEVEFDKDAQSLTLHQNGADLKFKR
ncbi:MAG TPA: serine hydrolase domain-containing protein [Candidatus Sulfopaludibacter sp.]|nr:serine hydrolase domain-containing protein [Candidatus Sulfopaludibacter sp.]